MYVTCDYLYARFNALNHEVFADALPPIQLRCGRGRHQLGCFRVKRLRQTVARDVAEWRCITITAAYDFTPEQLDDLLLHEMLHYYLHHTGVKDLAVHGPCFMKMMTDINKKFGRHITVYAALTEEQRKQEAERRHTLYIVAKVLLKDGRTAVKSLPRVRDRMEEFKKRALAWNKVQDVKLYTTRNPYFSRFPRSSVLKLQLPHDTDELEKAFADALELNL